MRMKNLCLLLVFLSLFGCKAREDSEDWSEEVVISGRVLNREVYPKEKEVTFVVPYLSQMETVCAVPIADDGTFSFRFRPYAPVREVGLRNYAEHLFVRPGDSLFVEVDFGNLLSPKITGTSGAQNQQMALFTLGGYYRGAYRCNFRSTPDEFERELEEERAERWERRADFLQKYAPGAEVEEYTEGMLWTDYYDALFSYAALQAVQGGDVSQYMASMPKLDSLFSGKTVFAGLFPLARAVGRFLDYKRIRKEARYFQLSDLVAECKDNAILPYLYLQYVGVSLTHNDTLSLATYKLQFDSIVQAPHLRQPILELYQEKVDYLKDPEKVSHRMLYGDNADETVARKEMPFMIPVYDLLKKHAGKVVYMDFWGVACPPCLAEMEPLKELRKRYSPDEVAMISICGSGSREEYRKILERFSLEGKDIECVFSKDWTTSEEFRRIMNHWGMHSIPQFLLVNRDGVIVDYGSALRPSFPSTAAKIDALIK